MLAKTAASMVAQVGALRPNMPEQTFIRLRHRLASADAQYGRWRMGQARKRDVRATYASLIQEATTVLDEHGF